MRRSKSFFNPVLILVSVSQSCRGLEGIICILHSHPGAPAVKQIRCWKRAVSRFGDLQFLRLSRGDRTVALRGDARKRTVITAIWIQSRTSRLAADQSHPKRAVPERIIAQSFWLLLGPLFHLRRTSSCFSIYHSLVLGEIFHDGRKLWHEERAFRTRFLDVLGTAVDGKRIARVLHLHYLFQQRIHFSEKHPKTAVRKKNTRVEHDLKTHMYDCHG